MSNFFFEGVSNMRILAIESSCDEFSMAIVENGNHCVMMETLSQIATHAKYGGVIPELASREHVKYFTHVLEKVKLFLDGDLSKIDAVAVTVGPGLSGSLLVGIQVAKTIATVLMKPLIPVHHILGHIFSTQLTQEITFPLLSLVVSGGHTEIIYSRSYIEHVLIGKTRDDAVGEVYDKIARQLSLPYPGGPALDKIAQQGKHTYVFKKPKMDEEFSFSFSGIKSAVINQVKKGTLAEDEIKNLVCSFQATVIDELLTKLNKATSIYQPKTVILCGGVSANKQLREQFLQLRDRNVEMEYLIPDLEYCGDNAAMIGTIANFLPSVQNEGKQKLECNPNLTITEFIERFL